MASAITRQEREEMIDFLKDHPIDPAYDEECDTLDGDAPEEQLTARLYQ